MNWVRRHFERHERRKPWNFCWRVTLEGVLVSIFFVAILYPFTGHEPRDFQKLPEGLAIVLVLLLAPVIETLLFQTLLIGLARLFRRSFRSQVLVSAIPFALVHFPEGVAVGVGAGVIGGLYLAYTYAHWARKSFWTAQWVTMISHALRNSLAVLAILFD